MLPDSTILLDQVLALTLRVVRGMTVHADRMLANLELTSARCSPSGCCSRSSRAACSATTRTGSSSGSATGVGHADAAASLLEQERSRSTSTGLRLRLLHALVPEVLARLEVIGSRPDPRRVETSADMFHEVPPGHRGSVPLLWRSMVAARRRCRCSKRTRSPGRHRDPRPRHAGQDELIAAGLDRARRSTPRSPARRAEARDLEGHGAAEFPLFVADHLRASGIELMVDDDHFVRRRRVKSAAEVEGIRRAQRAADAAWASPRADPRAAAGLTSEEVRTAMQASCGSTAASCPTT